MSAGAAHSHNSSDSSSSSRTEFPADYLKRIGDYIGPGFSIQELAGLLPQSQSVFGGAPSGISPYYGQQAQQGGAGPTGYSTGAQALGFGGGGSPSPGAGGADPRSYLTNPGNFQDTTPANARPQVSSGAQSLGFGQQASSSVPAQAGVYNPATGLGMQSGPTPVNPGAPPTRYHYNDIADAFGSDSGIAAKYPQLTNPDGFTLNDLLAIRNPADPELSKHLNLAINQVQARDQINTRDPRLAVQQPGNPSDALYGPGGAAGAANRLGFGAAPDRYNAPVVGATPGINAPVAQEAAPVTGALADVFGRYAPKYSGPTAQDAMNRLGNGASIGDVQKAANAQRDFERNAPENAAKAYENALYESSFRPQERELTRQSGITDAKLNASLAQSGLSTSGTGIGQRLAARRDATQQIADRSADAANAATAARFGVQTQQEFANQASKNQAALANQQTETQTRLANAGFSLDAQKQNASNVLQGNLANADNYLKTIGLNQQTATQARGDFLNLLGVQQADLARMNNEQRQNVELLLNGWLQQVGAITDAGRVSNSKSYSEGAGTSANASYGGSSGGGSGGSSGQAQS